uniref:Myosin heavy chain n=1 Tax=Plectus sambesii TaxID=2011161 RepID=A0A914WZ91_9BILA
NEGYISAQIKSEKDDTITVVTAKGNEMNLKKGLMQEMNPPKFEKTEDMSNLSFLNDASVLHNLRQRYFNMLIYTYSGLFCIVINPYKRLPIYTESVCKIFMGKRRNEVPPHLFAVSDEAYRNMLQDNECQSMLITGESGAGKTENTKKVIAYFAMVGASQQAVAVDVPGKKKVTLEDQIVQTNPVLEAFGNAKTVRNNNSSRFGKFIRIHFNGAGKLTGCDIEHYLLEKSRVVRQAPGERSYHIFYQIMSGHNPNLRADLELNEELIYYHNVSQAELKIDGVNDQEEFQMTDEAFDILKFSPEEKRDVYRLCSSMLHMGEMKFKQRPREEQAEADGTDEAEKTCRMLGDINHEEFLKALTKPRVKVGNDWVNKGQNLEQVNWSIGALVKGIYARIFDWLVRKCNQTLEGGTGEKKFFIGVLDIAGFETFDLNSFEQLWINFVNEKLQQFFNHHMFVLEQEEYAREGINWVFIDFGLDLAATIELIERPLGIISMLDEECIVPKATDLTYAQKLIDQHLGKHPKFTKPKPPKGKQGEAHFALIHYAGTVRYNVINWLEKNKDPLNDTAVGVMKTSKGNALLQTIWADYTTQEEAAKKAKEGGGGGGGKKGKSASMMTVSSMYRESLNKLMTMLHTTHPHFIRGIIPNERKTSGMIEAELVLNQLTCNGVLEGIRICRKGFPNRMVHNDFRQRYSLLAAEVAKSEKDPDTCARKMLDQLVSNGDLNDEQFRHGKTKVFFKAGVLAHMEDLRDAKLSAIMIGLQAKIRYYTAQLEYRRRQEQQVGLLVIQRNIRSWCTLRTWEWFKLYGAVKPMLKAGKEEEEMGKLQEQIKGLEDNLSKEEKLRQDVEGQCAKLMEEKNALFRELESAKGGAGEAEQVKEKLAAQKKDLEKQLQEVNERLTEQEERGGDLQKMKKKLESDCDTLKKNLQDMELSLRKSDSEKGNKDVQIRSLQEDMTRQDESIAKLNKEKKQQEEINRKLTEELQAEENKVAHVGKVRSKLEQTLDEIESNFEREKHVRQDIEKAKRKLEGELKAAQENINELNHIKHDLEGNLKKKESELMATTSRLEDESTLVARLQRQVKEEQIHVKDVEDELENERQNRAKVRLLSS